ncbi:WASH complex subunit 4 [Sabethes cyaneus]|uniref:WASH complex subunit 4 n=1 Tax=Sabethes cyaneus TaxID=53552 RepID=UPI00237D4B2A|nr:WASH complex subunit 4 [Sabethes cyaneus]
MYRSQPNLNYYGTTQIKEFGLFLEDYDVRLLNLASVSGIKECENKTTYVGLKAAQEKLDSISLIDTDNKVLNKILYTLSAMCLEANLLKDEFEEIIQEFLCFDESLDDNPDQLREDSTSTVDQSSLIIISDKIELLTRIKCYFERIIEVSVLILSQLGGLFDPANKFGHFNHVNWELHIMFDCLAELIYLPVSFDVIVENSVFKTFWKFYVKQIKALSLNQKRITEIENSDHVCDLSKAIDAIAIWCDGNAYKYILEAMFDTKQKLMLESASILGENFLRYLKHRITEINLYSTILPSNDEATSIIKLNGMVNMYHYIFVSIDGKVLKNVLDINEKFCDIPLKGKAIWVADDFFRKYGHKSIRDCDRNDYQKARVARLMYRKKSLVKDLLIHCIRIASWLVRITAAFTTTKYDTTLDTLRQKCGLILEGVRYAEEISFVVQSVTSLHLYLHESVSKEIFQTIGKMLEYLQCIHNFFASYQKAILEANQFIIQHLQHKIFVIVGHSKKKLISEAKQAKMKKSEAFIDKLSAFHVIERCMSGPANRKRLIVARLAISVSDPRQTLTPESYERIRILLNQLETLSNIQSKISQLCNTQFMYWHQSFFAFCVTDYYQQSSAQENIKFIIQNASMCCDSVLKASSDNKIVSHLAKSHRKIVNDRLMHQISNHIETYIRLDYYGKTCQIEAFNPFTDSTLVLKNIHSLLRMEPVLVGGQYLCATEHGRRYLSNTFYTLASISQHDWKIYKEMRCQAENYEVETIEDQLPKQTLEQGLDILEIMHNIEHFVSHYVYNLNFQIFIQQTSNNNFLNTVNISHIANSLRRHGNGIINTTVNYTFQFLRQKFIVFSNFLFDEQIKARLISDAKYFSENTDELNQTYDYNRAHAFNRKIKNLGLSENGETYMDLFRKLICHIGNAMGYVRMIRSGALHECTEATIYLPVIDGDLNFVKYAKEEYLHEQSLSAAQILENDINTLCKNYRIDTNYFRLLVNAFLTLRDPENIHLQNFYMIIPPLTINFVEFILKAKEKITKKDKVGALFTDDGFAMGIAFILKLLDQTNQFNSLHWFRSVKNKYNQEIEKLDSNQQLSAKTSDTDKLMQTFALTRRRLKMVQQEFDLLFCNLSSAKIFFNDAVD